MADKGGMAKPGRLKADLMLTDEERETLRRFTARRKSSQQLALRARIVLECATGADNTDVAERLGVSRPTGRRWGNGDPGSFSTAWTV